MTEKVLICELYCGLEQRFLDMAASAIRESFIEARSNWANDCTVELLPWKTDKDLEKPNAFHLRIFIQSPDEQHSPPLQ